MYVSLCPFPMLLRTYNGRKIKAIQCELFPLQFKRVGTFQFILKRFHFGYLLVFGHLVISRLINPWISETLLNTQPCQSRQPKASAAVRSSNIWLWTCSWNFNNIFGISCTCDCSFQSISVVCHRFLTPQIHVLELIFTVFRCSGRKSDCIKKN